MKLYVDVRLAGYPVEDYLFGEGAACGTLDNIFYKWVVSGGHQAVSWPKVIIRMLGTFYKKVIV